MYRDLSAMKLKKLKLCSFAATRAILRDITVPEDIGTITISVPRLGDLNQRSRGTLTYRLTSPEQARGISNFYTTVNI